MLVFWSSEGGRGGIDDDDDDDDDEGATCGFVVLDCISVDVTIDFEVDANVSADGRAASSLQESLQLNCRLVGLSTSEGFILEKKKLAEERSMSDRYIDEESVS